jgi:hypothetical protein
LNYQIPLLDQFIGVFILSFIIFLIVLGALYTYFSTKSARIHGIILLSIGMFLAMILFILGRFLMGQGRDVVWWNIFKIEAAFADLGALFGILAAIGLIMISIIHSEKSP